MFDYDDLVKKVCEALNVDMTDETRKAFVASCEEKNWEITIPVFIDRLIRTAEINKIIHLK